MLSVRRRRAPISKRWVSDECVAFIREWAFATDGRKKAVEFVLEERFR